MFGSLGIPELVVLLIIGLFYGLPIAGAIWALITLQRIRTDQRAMDSRLETIERLLQSDR